MLRPSRRLRLRIGSGAAAAAVTKFRARTLDEHLDQFDAFAESVVPLVDEP